MSNNIVDRSLGSRRNHKKGCSNLQIEIDRFTSEEAQFYPLKDGLYGYAHRVKVDNFPEIEYVALVCTDEESVDLILDLMKVSGQDDGTPFNPLIYIINKPGYQALINRLSLFFGVPDCPFFLTNKVASLIADDKGLTYNQIATKYEEMITKYNDAFFVKEDAQEENLNETIITVAMDYITKNFSDEDLDEIIAGMHVRLFDAKCSGVLSGNVKLAIVKFSNIFPINNFLEKSGNINNASVSVGEALMLSNDIGLNDLFFEWLDGFLDDERTVPIEISEIK